MKCSKCHNDIELDNTIFFPYGKGKLCRKCYKYYDLDIKEIEYKYKVLRGFISEFSKPYERTTEINEG